MGRWPEMRQRLVGGGKGQEFTGSTGHVSEPNFCLPTREKFFIILLIDGQLPDNLERCTLQLYRSYITGTKL